MAEIAYLFHKDYLTDESGQKYFASPYLVRIQDTDIQDRIAALAAGWVTNITALEDVPGQLSDLAALITAASQFYATKALMDAETGEADGTVALVFDDSTDSNNGLYSSDTGVWSKTTLQIASAADLAAKVDTTRTVSAAGLATGGGDLSGDRTITVTAASEAEAQAGTATNVVMTPERVTDHLAQRRGAADGVASLDSGGKVPADELPLDDDGTGASDLWSAEKISEELAPFPVKSGRLAITVGADEIIVDEVVKSGPFIRVTFTHATTAGSGTADVDTWQILSVENWLKVPGTDREVRLNTFIESTNIELAIQENGGTFVGGYNHGYEQIIGNLDAFTDLGAAATGEVQYLHMATRSQFHTYGDALEDFFVGSKQWDLAADAEGICMRMAVSAVFDRTAELDWSYACMMSAVRGAFDRVVGGPIMEAADLPMATSTYIGAKPDFYASTVLGDYGSMSVVVDPIAVGSKTRGRFTYLNSSRDKFYYSFGGYGSGAGFQESVTAGDRFAVNGTYRFRSGRKAPTIEKTLGIKFRKTGDGNFARFRFDTTDDVSGFIAGDDLIVSAGDVVIDGNTLNLDGRYTVSGITVGGLSVEVWATIANAEAVSTDWDSVTTSYEPSTAASAYVSN